MNYKEKYPIDYKKFRWFFTSSNKLVVGGKSANQNEELLEKLKNLKEDFVIMHTSNPGSPFSVILADKRGISKPDLEETAVFTACFSRAWRERKKEAFVDIFSFSQLHKENKMKEGTFGVLGKVVRKKAILELVLTRQEKILRAVPERTAKKKDMLLKIKPGKIDKQDMLPKFQVLISEDLNQEELLQALPPGGVSIINDNKKSIK